MELLTICFQLLYHLRLTVFSFQYRKAKTFSGRKFRHFGNTIRSAQVDGDIVKYREILLFVAEYLRQNK